MKRFAKWISGFKDQVSITQIDFLESLEANTVLVLVDALIKDLPYENVIEFKFTWPIGK